MIHAVDKSRLTQTQLKVAVSIISTLDKASENQLILLGGLSGVGKSSLLVAIAEDIREREGAIVEPETHRYHLGEAVKAQAGHVIVPFVPNEKRDIEKLVQAYSGRVSEFLLKGMTLKEITAHIRSLPMTNPFLTLEQLAEFSLGVPLLAGGINRAMAPYETAARMSANYLHRNLPPPFDTVDVMDYLGVEPPSNVLRLVQRWKGYPSLDEKNDFASFLLTLAENESLFRKQGIKEPSPFFVAPESERMHERMLFTRDTQCIICIYTPRISDADIARQICMSFGIGMEKKDDIELSNPDIATRARLFSGGIGSEGWLFRKTKFLLRSPDGAIYRTGDYSMNSNNRSFDGELRFISEFRNIPASVNIKGMEDVGFYFRKYEHSGGESEVSKAGWMVESLLQHLGVPYLANNSVADQKYFYNPAEKRIEKL